MGVIVMEQNDKILDINEAITEKMQPWIEYLIENYKDPNKVNSCLDVASDNIRLMESIIANASSYKRDFEMLKKIVLQREKERQETQQIKE
jgi:hypothetical protein